MTTTRAQASAAPVPIQLGANTYRMSPLRDVDYGEIDRWLASNIIRTARASLSDDMSDRERGETLRAAHQVAAGVSLASPEGVAAMNTVDGIARLIWMGVRQNHPDVTHHQIVADLMDPQTQALNQPVLEEIMDAFDLVNDIEPGAPKKKQRPRVKSRKPKRAAKSSTSRSRKRSTGRPRKSGS